MQEYSPYIESVVGFWEAAKTDPNILFITYEQLKKDFVAVAKKVAEFLGKEFTEEQLKELKAHCSFDAMKKNDMVHLCNMSNQLTDLKPVHNQWRKVMGSPGVK